MIKFFLMLYLASTLFCTIMLIITVYSVLKNKQDTNGTQVFFMVATPLLWAIWYMYYLN